MTCREFCREFLVALPMATEVPFPFPTPLSKRGGGKRMGPSGIPDGSREIPDGNREMGNGKF